MRRIDHPLAGTSLGQSSTLTSLHFGLPGARPKAYLQASLHAGELPGMLAAHHLRDLLQRAEDSGQIIGEVVLVPVANPIGLAQRIDHTAMGRFELNSSENFNRHYPDLAGAVFAQVMGRLGTDAVANVALVRSAAATWVATMPAASAVQSLRRTLVGLALDADLVLDLHCDCEAVMHVYSETACWPQIEPLAHLLQARAVLLASNTGASSFDECLSGLWWQLAGRVAAATGPTPSPIALPQACASATVELRGEVQVSHALAQSDAKALFGFLQHGGCIAGVPPDLPPASCMATPLAGSQTAKAPSAGMVVFMASPGDALQVGDAIAEVIDPIANTTVTVRAEVAGVLYARTNDRYALANDDLANIAGSVAYRTGPLLGA